MKNTILLLLALTLFSCNNDCTELEDLIQNTKEECNCYKGYFFITGPNIGQIAKGTPTAYSKNCNDDGITFPEDNLIWTMKLKVKCIAKKNPNQ
jgi:hypothetical protein